MFCAHDSCCLLSFARCNKCGIVQLIGSTFCVLFYAHDSCCLLSFARCNKCRYCTTDRFNFLRIILCARQLLSVVFRTLQQVQIFMASILMSCPIPRSSALETLMRLQTLLRLYDLVEKLPKSRKRKSRIRKKELPYHKRRRRVNWHEWVRELGPENFYVHHRMRRDTFEKLLRILGDSLHTEASKVRYGSGPVTPRMQLTMCLKFLGGDSNHDIKKHMGGVCM